MASHLSGHASLPSLKYQRPVDKVRVGKNVAIVVAAVLGVWRLWPSLGFVIRSRYIWAFISLVRCLSTSAFTRTEANSAPCCRALSFS